MAVAISIHATVATGDTITIVYFRPMERSENAAKILPIQAPAGGIEPLFFEFQTGNIIFVIFDKNSLAKLTCPRCNTFGWKNFRIIFENRWNSGSRIASNQTNVEK